MLQLGALELERLDGAQRLGRDPGLLLLRRLRAAGAALGQHLAVDQLAAFGGLLGTRRGGRRRGEPARERRQAAADAARPFDPKGLGLAHDQRGGHEVAAAPRRRVACEACVGQGLEPVRLPAGAQYELRQPGPLRRRVRPAPAHAHQAAVGARRQPLDRLDR